MKTTVLITGGSGLVGTRLTELLETGNYDIRHLSRNAGSSSNSSIFEWDLANGTMDHRALDHVDAIVHLAGAGVAEKRWTRTQKQHIIDSRTLSAKVLGNALEQTAVRPKVIIAASGVGYYGIDTGASMMAEEDSKGDGFLAEVVEAWENASDALVPFTDRLVKLRIGIVLSMLGGALPKIVEPIRYGVGSALGTGQQFMSCIHIDDLCRIIIWAIENSISGTYNAVGPDPVTNKDLTQIIARALGKPAWMPNVPSFVLKLLLGEMANLVLGGNKVSCAKLIDAGFDFEFGTTSRAVDQIFSKN